MDIKEKSHTKHGYPGLLIVIEGTDGAGRSTQIEKLREWLAIESYGVVVSQWKTSKLMSNVIDNAKERNLLNAYTFSLLYASDFADRLEQVIVPALKAGLVVLADRYTYTAYARDVVRGVSPEWARRLYDYAPEPDMVFRSPPGINTSSTCSPSFSPTRIFRVPPASPSVPNATVESRLNFVESFSLSVAGRFVILGH